MPPLPTRRRFVILKAMLQASDDAHTLHITAATETLIGVEINYYYE